MRISLAVPANMWTLTKQNSAMILVLILGFLVSGISSAGIGNTTNGSPGKSPEIGTESPSISPDYARTVSAQIAQTSTQSVYQHPRTASESTHVTEAHEGDHKGQTENPDHGVDPHAEPEDPMADHGRDGGEHADNHTEHTERYHVAVLDFHHVSIPYIVSVWIVFAMVAKIGKYSGQQGIREGI